jgi:hypothetical protein
MTYNQSHMFSLKSRPVNISLPTEEAYGGRIPTDIKKITNLKQMLKHVLETEFDKELLQWSTASE